MGRLTTVLTRTTNVASRVLKREQEMCLSETLSRTIFELVQDIIETHLLTVFHDDRTIHVAYRVNNAPQNGGHVFLTNRNHFRTRLKHNWDESFTKFHEDRTINVATRVKNSPAPCGHVFQTAMTMFDLDQDIIETNFLTKLQEDRTINVASSKLTRQMFTPHDAKRTKGDQKSSP
ncbi:hypothetical protein DPMN_042747 [Dreissena polymorpha]|uniref:Uncharacterized protein n=1 Tax=Dreissena polymorpha TaxID=45954 RepID=A0A9D4D0Y1_DREPO|nr:hypothetical protein DPMN_042747 [Dreissena polymorpha]